MKWTCVLISLALVVNMGAQTKSKPTPVDTMVKLGGRKLGIIYKQENSNQVTYALPSKPDSFISIDKKDIETITFKTGRKTVYHKPVLQTLTDDHWQTVLPTKDKKQTEGLYKLGYFNARSNRSATSKKQAFEQAVASLQKKAAAKKAYIVLIEEEQYPGGYGDTPSCYLEGSAWGMEPPEKGTSVIQNKKK
jgi:hypothetical protein